MLSTKQSQVENVAGNTLRKWQRCNFLELDTDWVTHENILYIHILWAFVHIPIYRGHTHHISWGIYIYRRERTLCEQKGRNEKSQKKRTTRHNVFYFIIMTTTCLCMYICTCAYYYKYVCIYKLYVGLDTADSVDVSSDDDVKYLGTELRL